MRKIRRFLAAALGVLTVMMLLTGCYTTADFGYIDKTGEWVLKPIYQQAYPFHEGYAVTMWGISGTAYGYGLIDHAGEYITDFSYDAMRGYYGGRVIAKKVGSDFWAYYDLEGNNLFGDKFFADASIFAAGLAPAAEPTGDNLYGYIDETGEWAIEPRFELASIFDEDSGLAMVRRGGESTGKYGYIDRTGELVIDYRYSYAGTFSEGFAPVKISTIKGALDWAFIDTTGEIVLQGEKWGYCREFSEGLAAVCIGDPEGEEPKWGYIDTAGNWVLEPQFTGALSFTEGLAAVDIGDDQRPAWGYIDKKGNLVIEAKFEAAGMFSEGVASAYDYDYR